MASDRGRRPPNHERRVFHIALLAGLPAVVSAGWLLWTEDHPLRVRLTVTLIVVGAWLIGAALLRERVTRPLQTISNLLAALREGDYSIRARGASTQDGLSLALFEVNALSETLRSQRLRALEATTLLRRVIEEIDVAVFAFDGGAPASPGQPRRRAAAGSAGRTGDRPASGVARTGRVPGGRIAPHTGSGVPRRGRALGAQEQ